MSTMCRSSLFSPFVVVLLLLACGTASAAATFAPDQLSFDAGTGSLVLGSVNINQLDSTARQTAGEMAATVAAMANVTAELNTTRAELIDVKEELNVTRAQVSAVHAILASVASPRWEVESNKFKCHIHVDRNLTTDLFESCLPGVTDPNGMYP